MAVLHYIVKGKINPKTIYVRLINGRETDLTCSSGFVIDEVYWSKAKKFINPKSVFKGKETLEKDLNNLRSFVFNKLNEDKGRVIEINSLWLKNTIAEFKNPIEQSSDLLIQAIENYRDRLKVKINPKTERPTSKATLKNYQTTLLRLKKFEEYKTKKFYLNEVDLKFHSEFMDFATNNLGLSINSIGTTLKQIKTVCLDALDRGLQINQQINSKGFNAPSEKTQFITLNENDLKRIKSFSDTDYLNNARDWLIIGCWTGCRVGDLMKLSLDNVKTNEKGKQFIRYVQSKTNKQIDVPIHKDVKEVLERLKSFPRPISDAKFNKYIKEVCFNAGINDEVKGTRQNPNTHKKETGTFEKWELVKSHTCRRSFATNHYEKLPNKLIMAITGHSTEKMLLDYIGETEKTHLDDFYQLWNESNN